MSSSSSNLGSMLTLTIAISLTTACAASNPAEQALQCPPAPAATPAPAAAATPAPVATEAAPAAAEPAPVASTPPAAPAPPPGPPKPSPELDQFMKNILGTWKCTAIFPAGGFGPGSPETKTASSVKFSKGEPALGGFFYRAEYTMPKSNTVPFSLAAIFYLGYEPATKQITNIAVDSVGGFQLGMGPLNDTTASWTATTHVMGGTHNLRETLTKVSDKELTHKVEIDMGQGFKHMGQDVCTR